MSEFIYDEVPYPSATFAQTHPDRLAMMATLYGMQPAPVEKCRVLELGCGDGTNLLAQAYALPESEFVGVDLSAHHIEDANRAAAELGLQNVRFEQKNVLEIGRETYGEFDYITAHGLFSWVPDFVRDKVLKIYRECLAPNGVGYISYNAYPGCHIRQMLREMMSFHTAEIEAPMEKVNQGLGLLNFLTEASEDDSVYQNMLKIEFDAILERSPQNIFHDDFSDVNQPFYFSEFAAEARKHGLQYLAESEYAAMQTLAFPPQTRQAIEALAGGDIIKREQYLDFIKARRFRQTLLCHENVALNRELKGSILNNFYLTTMAHPQSTEPEIAVRKVEKFVGAKGAAVQTDHPVTKAALVYLSKRAPRVVKFDDLIESARQILAKAGYAETDWARDVETASNQLLQILATGVIRLHTYEPHFTAEISPNPTASRFARWLISRNSKAVTGLNSFNIEIEHAFVRALLPLLDGTRNRDELIKALAEKIETGEIAPEGVEKAEVLRQLPDLFDYNLAKIAEATLLIA